MAEHKLFGLGSKIFFNITTKLYKTIFSDLQKFFYYSFINYIFKFCFDKKIEKYLFQPIIILIKLRIIKPLWCIFMSLTLKLWARGWQSSQVKYLFCTLFLWLWWYHIFFHQDHLDKLVIIYLINKKLTYF